MQPIVRILIVVSSTSLRVGELYFDVEKKPVIISIVRLLISEGSGWMLMPRIYGPQFSGLND